VEAGLLAVAAAATQIAEVPVEVDVASAETGEGIKGGVPADKGALRPGLRETPPRSGPRLMQRPEPRAWSAYATTPRT
jgi:hypothetical protein